MPHDNDGVRFSTAIKIGTTPEFNERLSKLADRRQISVAALVRQTMVRVLEDAERTDLEHATGGDA